MSAPALRIEGELTIYRAAELKPVLLTNSVHLLREYAAFDLSQVTDVDTAGVQLLLLAQREARARQAPLRLTRPSAAVSDAFALLGLAHHLS